MKPAAFDYYCPNSIDEALAMLASAGDEARFLAGGQSLVPMMALRLARPSALIDLNRVDELFGIAQGATHIEIGAMTRQEDLAADAALRTAIPVLGLVVDSVGHPGTRTRGTIGGSLCHADPAAEIPALLLAVDAEVVLRSVGGHRRLVPVERFFGGHFETTIADDEILTHVRIPLAERRMGFAEIAPRSADFATAGAIASVVWERAEVGERGEVWERGAGESGPALGAARAVVFALGDRPRRLVEVEEAVMASQGQPEAVASAARRAAQRLSARDEPHRSAAYQRRLGVTVVRQALEQALGARP